MVRLRTRLPSRQPSRRRMAGRELRLGTMSIYLVTLIYPILSKYNRKDYPIHGNINELTQDRFRKTISNLARF